MAERRMFAKSVTDSDVFLDMPLTSQALYFHLGMHADDDGFVGSPRVTQRMIGAQPDDLNVLCAKGFVIPMESGVMVIRHWKQNNWIQKDRYRPTVYQDEMSLLSTMPNKAYVLTDSEIVNHPTQPACIQPVSILDAQDRLDKDRPVKGREGEDNEAYAAADGGLGETEDDSGVSSSATIVAKVVSHLNSRCDKHYSANSELTNGLISSLLQSDYKPEDLKHVIDVKAAEWKGDPKMDKYLRPETLFGPKFEKYLNEGKAVTDAYSEYD